MSVLVVLVESDLCSKEGEQEVDVDGDLDELGVDEGDVHPGKVDQPSVGLGNVREIPVSLRITCSKKASKQVLRRK